MQEALALIYRQQFPQILQVSLAKIGLLGACLFVGNGGIVVRNYSRPLFLRNFFAGLYPCSAERLNHFIASSRSFATPIPSQ